MPYRSLGLSLVACAMSMASVATAQTAASGSAPGGMTASEPAPGPGAALAGNQTSGAQEAMAPATTAPVGSVLQEVVVTAQRRRENLQDVPITVTAVNAAKLSAGGVQNTQDLIAVVPGLTFPSSEGTALPHIRGVGSTGVAPGAENSVALYVDGVYYAAAAGSILSLNNVSQIEVLKGPQGTLFGRNATGGLIEVITKDPTQDFHGDASVRYANYDTTSLDGYVTGGLMNNLAADLAVQLAHQGDGWACRSPPPRCGSPVPEARPCLLAATARSGCGSAHHAGLLEKAGRDRGSAAGRLAEIGRRGLHGRAGLGLRRRSPEEHDQRLRVQGLAARGGGRPAGPSRDPGGGGRRHSRSRQAG